MKSSQPKKKTTDVVRSLVRDLNAQALTIRAIMNLTNLSEEQIQKESMKILDELAKINALPPDLIDGVDYDYDDDGGDEDEYDLPDDGDEYYDDEDESGDYDDDDDYDDSNDVSYGKAAQEKQISLKSGVSHHPAGAFVFGG